MEGLKKIVGFVVGIAAFFVAFHLFSGGDKLKAFEEFRCPEGRFTVMMPGEPKRQVRTEQTIVGPINMVIYTVDSRKSAFVISYADYPEQMVQEANLKDMLDGATQGALANSGGRLLETFDSNFQGNPGREIRMELTKDGDTATLRAWHILVKNRLYQLMVIAESDDVVNEKGREFYDSLIIDDAR